MYVKGLLHNFAGSPKRVYLYRYQAPCWRLIGCHQPDGRWTPSDMIISQEDSLEIVTGTFKLLDGIRKYGECPKEYEVISEEEAYMFLFSVQSESKL